MNSLLQLVKADYQQRTRSYGFLVTLSIALAFGYSFVPPLDAPYSTIRIGDYIGNYNSAWFGYVMAVMSSIFISYFGYFIINDAVKRDAETGLGEIMATTQTSNFTYLFAKFLSNFLVLLSLLLPVMIMGVFLFFLYGSGSFKLGDFVTPFALVCLPMLALTAALAILLEIVFRKSNVLQYILFSMLFIGALLIPPSSEFSRMIDPFGTKIIINEMTEQVTQLTNEEQGLSIGYNIKHDLIEKRFEFTGLDFPTPYTIARFLWVLLSVFIVLLSSFVFHRFRKLSIRTLPKKQDKQLQEVGGSFEINLSQPLVLDFSILPLVKAEMLLLLRKQNNWLWILTLGGMVALALSPMTMAHQFILPILWFIHVTKWSRLVTKEYENRTSLFAAVSYKHKARLFTAQLLTATICINLLALPLVVRLLVSAEFVPAIAVLLGGVFVILLSTLLGLISKSSKLFEVLFFFLTYANINAIKPLDYFGAFHTNIAYLCILMTLVFSATAITYFYKSTVTIGH